MDTAMTHFRDVQCAACHCRAQDLIHKVLRPQSQVKGKEFQSLCVISLPD